MSFWPSHQLTWSMRPRELSSATANWSRILPAVPPKAGPRHGNRGQDPSSSQRLERNYWFQRIIGILSLIFGGVALLLASIGLYASMAHSVSQRTQEIGIRMAVGATEHRIHRLAFGQGLRQLAIGLVIGLAGAFAVTRVLTSALVEVSPSDPVTYGIATMVLSAAAAFGCLIPARRAMHVNPIVALYRD